MGVALIPARSGSKRIPDKNIYPLVGHPLMAYTIRAAIDSGIFDAVIVSTDSEEYAAIADKYGATVIIRPKEYATDTSPDIQWVKHCLPNTNWFSILRPTSPFRLPETIKRAYSEFSKVYDSLRAIELCKQHPYKMWVLGEDGEVMTPLIRTYGEHNKPYQTLRPVYIQNASLEMAWSYVLKENSISGDNVKPFFTQGYEGFDINEPYDIKYAEWLIESGQASLPGTKSA